MAKRTKENEFQIRTTTENDIPLILQFIRDLAEYEKLSNEVIATEEILRHSLFERKVAEAVIAEYKGEAAGFAIFFHNFSTFIGKPGIYLEDLFVKQEYRGKGFGKALLSYLAKTAIKRDCGRFEWSVLDWNEPSINFYKELGANFLEEWKTMRITGESLKELANNK